LYYNYIKALHLIFVITWFAGLFYIPRLFIYHIEASKKAKQEADILVPQLKIMAKRLWYIITWPSAILCIIFAFWLLLLIPSWIAQSWMQIKLTFVVLLIVYHLKTHQIFLKLQKDKIVYTSMFMRIWNEGATLLLFAIVFLVILKDSFHWVFGLLGILGLGLILVLGIKLYKKIRMDK
jgi:putative membrane protein